MSQWKGAPWSCSQIRSEAEQQVHEQRTVAVKALGRSDRGWVPTKLCLNNRARSRCQANSSGNSVERRKAKVSRYTGHAILKSSPPTSDVSLSFCFAVKLLFCSHCYSFAACSTPCTGSARASHLPNLAKQHIKIRYQGFKVQLPRHYYASVN